jgi:NitT/TauT family transport system permease protein
MSGMKGRNVHSIPLVAAGRLLVPVVLLALWWASYRIIGDSFILASPWVSLYQIWEGVRQGWLASSVGTTLLRVVASFMVAGILGTALGVLLGLSRFWHDLMEPLVVAGWAAPKSVLYPVFILLLGLGSQSAIVFAAAWGIFPLIIMLMNGIRGIPRVYFKLCRTLGMGPVWTFGKVIAPAISLEFIVGLRYCWSLCFLGMIVIEMFGAKSGVGRDLLAFQEVGDMKRMLAVVVVVVVITVLISFAFYQAESSVVRKRGLKEGLSIAR